MSAITLSLKLINIESSSKLGTKFYFCYDNTSTPVYKHYDESTPSSDPTDGNYIIPYTSIVFVKDTHRFWTHGLWYEGTDANSSYGIGSDNLSFTIGSDTFQLSLVGNTFLITKSTPASWTITAVADTQTSTGGGTYYDNAAHSWTASCTPSNAVTVSLKTSGTHLNVTLSKVQFSTDKSNWGDATYNSTTKRYSVSSGTTGYSSAASSSGSTTSGTGYSGTPTTQYVRVAYTQDGSSTIIYSSIITISHSQKSVTISQNNRIFYKTSETGAWTKLGDYSLATTAFTNKFNNNSYVAFAWPSTLGSTYVVSYGAGADTCVNIETSMFPNHSTNVNLSSTDSSVGSRSYDTVYRSSVITNGCYYKISISK